MLIQSPTVLVWHPITILNVQSHHPHFARRAARIVIVIVTRREADEWKVSLNVSVIKQWNHLLDKRFWSLSFGCYSSRAFLVGSVKRWRGNTDRKSPIPALPSLQAATYPVRKYSYILEPY